MTNEQAIKIMKEEKSWESDDRKIDAYNMAIEALEMKMDIQDCISNGISIDVQKHEPIEIVMRDATKEELKGVDDYIKSISTPTGKSFYR